MLLSASFVNSTHFDFVLTKFTAWQFKVCPQSAKHFIKPLIVVDENIFLNDGQPGVIMYLNWFMLLYDEIPVISGGDVAEIKGKKY